MISPDDRYDTLFSFLTQSVTHIYSATRTLESVCHYFGATSGCLWELNGQSNNNIFNLSAYYNRPDLVNIINRKSENRNTTYKIKYNIRKDRTVSSETFKRCAPIIGRLGQQPFNNDWLQKEHTKGLRGLGVKKVALIPIFSGKNQPICSLSLYTRSDFSIEDIDFVSNFSRFFSALWVNSHIKVEDLTLEAGTMRHEIAGSIIPLRNTIEKLSEHKEEISKAVPSERVYKHFDDIASKLSSIKNSLSDNRLSDRVKKNKSDAYFIDLRTNLNSVIQPLIQVVKHNILSLDSIYYPKHSMKIFMHKDDFEQLFRNIISNAVKYSTSGSSIRITITQSTSSTLFTISNISKPLPKEDWRLIWEPRYRSASDKSGKVEGDGLGLHIARVICRQYGFSYNFIQENGSDLTSDNLVWSRVKLNIPNDMIK